MRRSRNRLDRVNRTGTVLVCTLVCLLVSTSLAGVLIHSALRSRRHVHAIRQMRQTELLLDAGVLRAASVLKTNPDYRGEIWRPSTAIDRFPNPRVTIEVTDSDQRFERIVEVSASLGIEVADDTTSSGIATRRSHHFMIQLSRPKSPE